MWISPFSSHTAPFLLEGTHSTMVAGLGWLPTTAASGIWSHQVPSFVQFWSYVWLTVPVSCLLGVIIYPCISLLIGVPQVLDISDRLLSSMGSTVSLRRLLFSLHISHMTGEGRERALGAPSPWHTEYCLCSLQHPLKRKVPVNFSHLREGSCIQQATRFQLCVYFSKRPEWYKWPVFYIFNIQICKELWGLNSKYMMSGRCLIYIVS